MAKAPSVTKQATPSPEVASLQHVRLTKDHRKQILAKLLKHAFEERREALTKEESNLGLSIYHDIYPTILQNKMKALPDGFLPTRGSGRVSFGGQVDVVILGRSLRISEYHQYHVAKAYASDDPFSIRYFEIEKAIASLREEQERARVATKSVLESCSSTKSLLAVWPEVEPFLVDFRKNPPVMALTVCVKDLNQQLRL